MAEADRRRVLDEIALLEASLSDAKDEHERGELDDASFRSISTRDWDRIEELKGQLAAGVGAPADQAAPPAPEALGNGEPGARPARRRRLVVAVILAVMLIGSVVTVVAVMAPGGSGQSSTGWTTGSSTKVDLLLAQAATLVQKGEVTEALTLYAHVLSIDPKQPEALAQTGWLTFQAGAATGSASLMAKGEAEVHAAVKAAPSFAVAHLYLGAIDLLGAKDPTTALGEFKVFLALKPSAYWISVAQPFMEEAAKDAGVPVPTTTP